VRFSCERSSASFGGLLVVSFAPEVALGEALRARRLRFRLREPELAKSREWLVASVEHAATLHLCVGELAVPGLPARLAVPPRWMLLRWIAVLIESQ
jgi:hypothetical protein